MSGTNDSSGGSDHTAWHWIERIVEEFEQAWRRGQRPALADYLKAGGADRRALLVQLVHADLECRLKAGEAARVEAYLRDHPDLADDDEAVLGLLAREYDLRRRLEPDLSLAEYHRRFPRHAERWLPLPPDSSRPPHDLSGASTLPEKPAADSVSGAPDCPAPPGYEVVGRLGKGGMGIVYQARQTRLGRLVALKMIRDEALADAEQRARFQAEAEAVARLRHPHIVQVFDVGEHDGHPYIALEYVEGGSLAARLARGPLPLREALRLLEPLARAVHHAHRAGIVHRDLTPANVLLASDGSPRVSDFGLAKRLDAGADQTRTGAVLGTPAYMAPEQAAGQGKRVGIPADVYALGAILYEMLTGRPPFRASTTLETLRRTEAEEPTPPRRLDPRLPRDIETLCLKCLEKDPTRRYASAQELAEDVRRFLAGEPVRARPAPAWRRAAKWARRRPAAAALFLVSALALAAAVAGLAWHGVEQERALAYAREKEHDARDKAEQARRSNEEAQRQLHAADLRAAYQLWHSGDVGQARARLLRHAPRPDAPAGFAWRYLWRLCQDGASVHAPLPPGAVSPGDLSSEPAHDRPKTHDAKLVRLTPSPDGRRLAAARADYSVLVREAEGQTWTRLGAHTDSVEVLAFADDGRSLASGGRDGSVRLWDLPTAKERAALQHRAAVSALAVNRDGSAVAVADVGGTLAVYVWPGVLTIPLRTRGGVVRTLAFAPDDRTLASVADDNVICLWDINTSELRNALRGHTDRVTAVAFSPDGRRLTTAGRDGTVKVWDPAVCPGRQVLAAAAPAATLIAWSPDGRLVATASQDRSVRLWDARTWRPAGRLPGHCGDIHGLAFSPDGHTLATAGADRTVRLWDTAACGLGEPAGSSRRGDRRDKPGGSPRLGHDTAALCVAFSADGKALATGEENGKVTLWPSAGGAPLRTVTRHAGPVRALAFSPDGRTLATAGDDRIIRLWDARSWQAVRSLEQAGGLGWLAFSPDSRSLAAVEGGGAVVLWDLAPLSSGDAPVSRPLGGLAGPGGPYRSAVFAPDGRTLALAGRNSAIWLWDVGAGRMPAPRRQFGDYDQVAGVAFAPDGRTLAASHHDGRLAVWDLGTGRVRRPAGPAGPVLSLAFAPDGTLAAAGGTRAVRVRQTLFSRATGREAHFDSLLPSATAEALHFWDAPSGRPLSLLPDREGVAPPSRVAFSPDGRTLATGHSDGTVALWDRAGRRRATLFVGSRSRWLAAQESLIDAGLYVRCHLSHDVRALAFSPDGRTLGVVAPDGAVQLWDAEAGSLRGTLPGRPADRTCLAFSPDRRTLATHTHGRVELWDVETRQLRRDRPLQRSAIRCLAFSPDGALLAAGGGDRSIQLWDLGGDRETPLAGHTDRVSSLAFSPDGRTLASAGFDGTVRLWDVDTAQEVMALEGHAGKVRCLAFSPDGLYLATGGETPQGSGEVYLWPAGP
jgi:WD40 repeat protein/tRNA A-37 threonylcarbamoyl transferase component Bud32